MSVCEWEELVEGNKEWSLSSNAVLWIYKRKRRQKRFRILWNFFILTPFTFEAIVLQNWLFLFLQINPSSTFVIELMIFPHTNIKTSGNINLVTRKWKAVRKVAFQALLERLISVMYYENPDSQNLLLALESTS